MTDVWLQQANSTVYRSQSSYFEKWIFEN